MGTAAMSALLLLPRWLGIGKIDVIPAVGALITGKAENALPIGYVVHFTSGIIFAYVYWGLVLLMKLPVNAGGVTSEIHLTVRDVVAVLLQPSLAVNVLVIARLHPSETIEPSDEVIVTAPQASVAVAVPNEPFGSAGLQPRFTSA